MVIDRSTTIAFEIPVMLNSQFHTANYEATSLIKIINSCSSALRQNLWVRSADRLR